jgi:hypothetical protein
MKGENDMSANIHCYKCGARPYPQLGAPGTRQDFDLLKLVQDKNGSYRPAEIGEGEWFWPIAKARRNLIHSHPWFHGVVQLTSRPRWVERTKDSGSPRHNFCWCVWGAQPRQGDAWIRWAGKARPSLVRAR